LKQAGRRLLDSGSDPKLARRIFRFIRALLKIRRDLLPKPEPAKTWRRRRAILRSQVISLGNFPHTLAILFSAFTDGARAAEQGINWQQLKNMDPPPPANFERWRRPYVYERLAEVQTPTLIVCSEYLFRAPWRREVIDELSDKLSNAVVARMPSSSGLLQLEYPKLFNVIVLDFLRDRLGRRGAGE
jgi:pimeloyl-ACP methyl ester carboxylesterase